MQRRAQPVKRAATRGRLRRTPADGVPRHVESTLRRLRTPRRPLAVTAHPDFDDTPKYDEDGDGNAANDGKTWHSHWVVLVKDQACPAGLKVQDVAPGVTVKMPATAPGVPLLLDSPDVRPVLGGSTVTVSVPMPEGGDSISFDGVAAGLRVNAKMEAPLLCVTDVFKVASGDLSLPGKVAP